MQDVLVNVRTGYEEINAILKKALKEKKISHLQRCMIENIIIENYEKIDAINHALPAYLSY